MCVDGINRPNLGQSGLLQTTMIVMAALGPIRRFTAAQQDVCNGGQTRRSADEDGTVPFDP